MFAILVLIFKYSLLFLLSVEGQSYVLSLKSLIISPQILWREKIPRIQRGQRKKVSEDVKKFRTEYQNSYSKLETDLE